MKIKFTNLLGLTEENDNPVLIIEAIAVLEDGTTREATCDELDALNDKYKLGGRNRAKLTKEAQMSTYDFEYETSNDREYFIELEVVWTLDDGTDLINFEFYPIRRGKILDTPIQMGHPDYLELEEETNAYFDANVHTFEVEIRSNGAFEPEYYYDR